MHQLKNLLLVITLASTAPLLASDDQMMLLDAGLLSQGQGTLEQWVETALHQGKQLIESAKASFSSPEAVPVSLPQVLTHEIPTSTTPVPVHCAAAGVTTLGDKFLAYGLSTETVLAKNKTYYIANMTKVFAAAFITYGLYKVTRYAYNHYRKKDK